MDECVSPLSLSFLSAPHSALVFLLFLVFFSDSLRGELGAPLMYTEKEKGPF